MRKSIITALLAIITLGAGAQSADDALKKVGKDNEKAKEMIDKVVADPANAKNADAWYAKAQVYNAIATDDKLKASVPDAFDQAFDAFRKAYEADANGKRMLLDGFKTGFIAYEGVANKAAKAYQENNLQAAFDGYKKTLDDGDWLRSKQITYSGYKVPPVDTGIVFMTGYTAMKLNKNEDAIPYFTKFADAKIGKEPDYVIPYQFLAYQYKAKKDAANFKKYVDLGQEVYPKDAYFVTIKLDWARENNDYPALFKGYDELIAKQPDSVSNNLAYASDMFDYLFIKSGDTKPADFDAVSAKVEEQIKITLAKNYEPMNSNLIICQLYYNEGLDIMTEADKVKGVKPEDTKKKADLKAKAVVKYDQAIPYTEKVVSIMEQKDAATFSNKEKHTLKNMYLMLEDMYSVKGDKAKSDAYDKKYSAIK